MNPKEYISWGILESYVLGSLDEEEVRDVEQKLAQYSELREELAVIRRSLEKYSTQFCVVPEPSVKESVLGYLQPVVRQEAVVETKGKKSLKRSVATPETLRETKGRTLGWGLLTAAFLIAVATGGAAFYFWQHWKKAEERIVFLEHEKASAVGNISTAKSSYEEKSRLQDSLITQLQSRLNLFLDSNTRFIELKGLPHSTSTKARLVWKQDSGELYLLHPSLPVPVEGKQYQLWAQTGGSYTDAGLIELNDTLGIQQMKNITEAEAFEISLEEQGGGIAPNTKELYMKGKF